MFRAIYKFFMNNRRAKFYKQCMRYVTEQKGINPYGAWGDTTPIDYDISLVLKLLFTQNDIIAILKPEDNGNYERICVFSNGQAIKYWNVNKWYGWFNSFTIYDSEGKIIVSFSYLNDRKIIKPNVLKIVKEKIIKFV
ncbi:hypothetical protein [uncultured Arcobacter sp.]|uniref:hypothetical protein n=1 Tax=uncultured Arcobacter sp. TaxID=165434 RepID=UPI002602D28B|nr:hypothetical protein [uncultured Arcobacter sp.]